MALLLKESSDLISAYHHQQQFHRHHPIPSTFHHPLSSSSSSSTTSSTTGHDYNVPTNSSPVVHPTPKYPLDLRTTIIEQPFDAQESAARILFSAINWAKTVPAFLSLSNRDQVSTISSSLSLSLSLSL
jgi:hypothetical protein